LAEIDHQADAEWDYEAQTPTPPATRTFHLKDWPRGWTPDFYLFGLVAIVGLLASVRLQQRIAIGPSWDTYAFLDNAADMAGRSVGYVEPHRPPLLSFLTSLLLRLGVWNVATIQTLDVGISVLGVIAFYILLRRRVERPLAMVTSVLLLLVPPLWSWLGSGYTDFPSVALSIVALLLVVKATEDDPRWYLLALPMVLFSILTRFGAFLMIVPVVLWMALRAQPFRQAKEILGGIALCAIAYVPAGLYYYKYFSDPFFPFGFAGNVANAGLTSANGVKNAVSTPGFHLPDFSAIPGAYYIKHIVQLLFRSPAGLLTKVAPWVSAPALPSGGITWGGLFDSAFFAATIAGLVVAIAAAFIRQRAGWRRFLPAAAIVLLLLAEWRGGTVVRVGAIAILGFCIASFMVPRRRYREIPSPEKTNWQTRRILNPRAALALDATVLVWGLLFLDAHGHMQPQIDRYFITMAPAAMYFIGISWRTLGIPLTALLKAAPDGLDLLFFRGRFQLKPAGSLACVVGLLAIGTVTATGAFGVFNRFSAGETEKRDKIVLGAEQTADWLKKNDPHISEKTVYSDVWPLTSWYLGSTSYAMPTFESLKAFPHELTKNKVDYFVTIRPRRYPGYVPVFGAASTTVLRNESTFPRALPAIAYLGDGWDAYVEQLCNFDCDLYFSGRGQIGTGTWMLDGLTPQQLAQYDAVAVFGAHWRNKGVAENTLRTYVENGGVVILDASHNMDGFNYPLVDTVFMDMLVRRDAMPANSAFTVAPQLAAESQVPQHFAPSPLVDEHGGPWYGANYEPATWSHSAGNAPESFETLAYVGSRPAILLQRLGKGRIYWISNNLVWHAYLEGNQDEIRLIRGVFRDAVGLPPIPSPEVASAAKPWFVSRKLRPVPAKKRLRIASAVSTSTPEATSPTGSQKVAKAERAL
jgi:hypothetical protein